MTNLRPLEATLEYVCPECGLIFSQQSNGTCINGKYYCDTCLEEEANDNYEEALANG